MSSSTRRFVALLIGTTGLGCSGHCYSSFSVAVRAEAVSAWMSAGGEKVNCPSSITVVPKPACPSEADALRFLRTCSDPNTRYDALKFGSYDAVSHSCLYTVTGQRCEDG